MLLEFSSCTYILTLCEVGQTLSSDPKVLATCFMGSSDATHQYKHVEVPHVQFRRREPHHIADCILLRTFQVPEITVRFT